MAKLLNILSDGLSSMALVLLVLSVLAVPGQPAFANVTCKVDSDCQPGEVCVSGTCAQTAYIDCTATTCDNGSGGCTTNCANKACDSNNPNWVCRSVTSGCRCRS